jgi:ABC-type glycerol-3-phosphate transport system substrate-binding protein
VGCAALGAFRVAGPVPLITDSLLVSRNSGVMIVRKLLKVAAPLLAVGVLAACSSQGSSSSSASSSNAPVTIDFWNTYTGPLETELASIVKEFESTHPDITVKLVYQPYATELQSLETAVAAKQPPALAQIEMSTMGQLASDGALAPVSSLLSASSAKALKASIVPSIASVNSYQGQLYTVPFGYNSNILYYNKTILAKDGITPPTTWAELEADAKKVSEDSDGKVSGYVFPAAASWILEARFWQTGTTLFNTAGTQAEFNSPQGVAMFTNYQQLLATKAAKMVTTDADLDQLTDLFAAGKAAMFEQSSTAVQSIASEAKVATGEATFPTMGQKAFSMGATTSASSTQCRTRRSRPPPSSRSGGPARPSRPSGRPSPTTCQESRQPITPAPSSSGRRPTRRARQPRSRCLTPSRSRTCPAFRRSPPISPTASTRPWTARAAPSPT